MSLSYATGISKLSDTPMSKKHRATTVLIFFNRFKLVAISMTPLPTSLRSLIFLTIIRFSAIEV